jgi:hypothetical protein
VFGSHFLFKPEREAIAMGIGSTNFSGVDFMIVYPPFVFAFDGGLLHARHAEGFHTDNVRAIKFFNGFEIFALLAQGDNFFPNLHN